MSAHFNKRSRNHDVTGLFLAIPHPIHRIACPVHRSSLITMTFFSLLLSALLPLVAAALAKDICLNNPTIYRFSHGEIRGTIVSDGPLIMTDSPFAVPDEAVRRSYRTAFRKTTPFVLSQNVAVLDVPRVGRVLVDSGSLNTQALVDFTEKAGRLSENLDAAGISKHSIDYIFITHGHIDHVAGIRDTDGSPTFPNATLVIGKMEHEYWSNPTPNVNNLLPNELLGTPPLNSPFYSTEFGERAETILLTFISPFLTRRQRLFPYSTSRPSPHMKAAQVASCSSPTMGDLSLACDSFSGRGTVRAITPSSSLLPGTVLCSRGTPGSPGYVIATNFSQKKF